MHSGFIKPEVMDKQSLKLNIILLNIFAHWFKTTAVEDVILCYVIIFKYFVRHTCHGRVRQGKYRDLMNLLCWTVMNYEIVYLNWSEPIEN